jgi:hypothetical protein
MVEERREQAAVVPEGHLRHPYGEAQGRQGRHQGSQKMGHPEYQIGQFGFHESGQHLYSRELVRQTISDSTTSKFRRLGSSSARLSSGALLPGQAANAWVMGTSTDDVSNLSSMGEVVRNIGATANALPPGMVWTC